MQPMGDIDDDNPGNRHEQGDGREGKDLRDGRITEKSNEQCACHDECRRNTKQGWKAPGLRRLHEPCVENGEHGQGYGMATEQDKRASILSVGVAAMIVLEKGVEESVSERDAPDAHTNVAELPPVGAGAMRLIVLRGGNIAFFGEQGKKVPRADSMQSDPRRDLRAERVVLALSARALKRRRYRRWRSALESSEAG